MDGSRAEPILARPGKLTASPDAPTSEPYLLWIEALTGNGQPMVLQSELYADASARGTAMRIAGLPNWRGITESFNIECAAVHDSSPRRQKPLRNLVDLGTCVQRNRPVLVECPVFFYEKRAGPRHTVRGS